MSFFRRIFGSKKTTKLSPSHAAPRSPAASLAPFPFHLVSAQGADAVAVWRRYQAEWRKEGCSAVVIGDADEVKIRAELLSKNTGEVAEVLRAAAGQSAIEFFEQREAEYSQDEINLEIGEWPTEPVPLSSLSAHTNISSGQPKPTIYIAKIPTPHVWEIPAHLEAGGWNDCPDSAAHAAVLKYWHEKHGAEIYSLTADVLECVVSRPPTTREAALALAREQFLFCSDIVHQGTESVELLAASLLNAEVWFFWWD